MTKMLKKYPRLCLLLLISIKSMALNYGALAFSVLAPVLGVVAAPFVVPVVGAAAVAAFIVTSAVHAPLMYQYFINTQQTQPVVPASSPSIVLKIITPVAQSTAVKVNLTPMTNSQYTAYNSRKSLASTAKATTPVPAIPASGQSAARATCDAAFAPTIAKYKDSYSQAFVIQYSDSGTGTINCSLTCPWLSGSNCNLPQSNPAYPSYAYGYYQRSVPAVTCPTGSHQNGASCQVDYDPNVAAVVNPDNTKPQFDPGGIPSDAFLSADGSTITKTATLSDGTQQKDDMLLQPDGSMNYVQSVYDPATGKTTHIGYASDTNGVVKDVAAAVSQGNYATSNPALTVTMPNGANSAAQNGTGSTTGSGGGSCGGAGQPACAIDWGDKTTPTLDDPEMPDKSSLTSALSATGRLDNLLQFQLPAHTSTCPVITISHATFFNKSGSSDTSSSCKLVDDNKQSIQSIFSIIWTIVAIFILLSA